MHTETAGSRGQKHVQWHARVPTTYPALFFACSPVTTKMPPPMMAEMPKADSWNRFSTRFI